MEIAAILLIALLFLRSSAALFVFRDARRRGTDPVFWALITFLHPCLMGFVLYLAVRNTQTV